MTIPPVHRRAIFSTNIPASTTAHSPTRIASLRCARAANESDDVMDVVVILHHFQSRPHPPRPNTHVHAPLVVVGRVADVQTHPHAVLTRHQVAEAGAQRGLVVGRAEVAKAV